MTVKRQQYDRTGQVCVCVCVCVCVRIGLLQIRACLSVWSEVMREGHVHLKLVTRASWVN